MSFSDAVKTTVRQKGKGRHVDFSIHATEEAYKDHIDFEDVCHALSHEETELLEQYPDDPRGPSALFVGPDKENQMIHVVAGGFERDNLVIITVYRPEEPKWEDPFTRGDSDE